MARCEQLTFELIHSKEYEVGKQWVRYHRTKVIDPETRNKCLMLSHLWNVTHYRERTVFSRCLRCGLEREQKMITENLVIDDP